MKFPFKWDGSISIDGVEYSSLADIKTFRQGASIVLIPKTTITESEIRAPKTSQELQITVKSYMTKKATPEFDFMAKWNNDIPMPLRTMVGTIEKETKGMVYMKLHGDITSEITPVCMKCGKPITNPVSQYFGMGPVCGNHDYVNPFDSQDALHKEVAKYKQILRNITWEGWMPKSAQVEIKQV